MSEHVTVGFDVPKRNSLWPEQWWDPWHRKWREGKPQLSDWEANINGLVVRGTVAYQPNAAQRWLSRVLLGWHWRRVGGGV